VVEEVLLLLRAAEDSRRAAEDSKRGRTHVLLCAAEDSRRAAEDSKRAATRDFGILASARRKRPPFSILKMLVF
jgi:hypothetical protein